MPVVTQFGTANRTTTYAVLKVIGNRTAANLNSATNTMLIVGEAEGAEPYKPFILEGARAAKEAAALFRSGTLVDNMARIASVPRVPTHFIAVNAKPLTQGVKAFVGTGAPITVTASAGSTSTNLVVTAIAGLTGVIPKNTPMTFTGGKKVITTAPVANGATAIPIRTVSGAPVAAAETASVIEPVFSLGLKQKWGTGANQVGYVLTGNLTTGFTLVITDRELDNTDYVRQDKIGLAMTLVYTGAAGSTKVAEIVTSSGKKYLRTTIALAASENLDIELYDGMLVKELVRIINAKGVYNAQPNTSEKGTINAALLDTFTSASIATSAVQFTALKADLANFFAKDSRLAQFDYAEGGGAALATGSGDFEGGGTGATQTADWGKAVDAAGALPYATAAVLTDDETVNAGARSANKGRWLPASARCSEFFQGILNSALPADDLSNANVLTYYGVASAKNASVNDETTRFVANTFDIVDSNGFTRRAKPFEAAAIVAAMRAGNGPDEPLTDLAVPGSNVFPKFDVQVGSTTNSNNAVGAGLFIFEPANANGGVKIVQDVTSYIGAENDIYRSGSAMSKIAFMQRNFKEIMDTTLRGKNVSNQLLKQLYNNIEGFCKQQKDRGLIADGTNDNGDAVPAYDIVIAPTTQGGKLIEVAVGLGLIAEVGAGILTATYQTVNLAFQGA